MPSLKSDANFLLETHEKSAATNGSKSRSKRLPAVIVRAMCDVWVAYDEKAIGTRLGDKLRRPKSERTAANKEKAIAYATYIKVL